jgi:AcrR family transcriptional regulator
MGIREDFLRPRTDSENSARRAAILSAAEAVLMESSSQRFSIASVADRVGITQSTVFLHFQNREGLLAALYTQAGRVLFDDFERRLKPGMSDQEFCEAFIDSWQAFPLFQVMRPMVMRSIAESLSEDAVHQAVQEVFNFRHAAGPLVVDALDLEPEQGILLLKCFTNLASGAAQVDVQDMLNLDNLSEDVARFVRSTDLRDAFLRGAVLLLKGMRG